MDNADRAQEQRAMTAEDYYEAALEWRGIDPERDEVCKDCGGAGRRVYGSSATWAGGCGGQTMTMATCDGCWGSGVANKPGVNLKALRRNPGRYSFADHGGNVKTIGERLRRAREVNDMTQSQLSEATGLRVAAISHFETGRRKPCVENLKKLCVAMGVQSDWILGIDGERK